MNENKNFSTEMIAQQIKMSVHDKCLSRPNPLDAFTEEVKIYLDRFFDKMDKLLPRKSIDGDK